MYIHDDVKNESLNDKHIYLWNEQEKNEYEIIDILNNIFNNKTEFETKELKDIFEVLFKFNLELKRKIYKYN